MTNDLVELTNVTRKFDPTGTPAISEVTAAIGPRARIALMGRSGSGKSTLLNLIAGLDSPTSGSIVWPGLGERSALLPAKIGVMFQSRSLIPWLNVMENVLLPVQIAGRRDREDEPAASALAAFELEELADKLPDELSGGQAQRVSLARAIVIGPRLLLADEPTGQLDHTTAARVMRALLNWATRLDAALVVASHDQAIAELMDTVWQLDRGRIVRGALK